MVEQANVCFEHDVEMAWKGGGRCPACNQIKKLLAKIVELKNQQKVKNDKGMRDI